MNAQQMEAHIDELMRKKDPELRAALRAVLSGQKAALCELAPKIGQTPTTLLCIVAQMRPDEKAMYDMIFGRYQRQKGERL